MLISSLTLPFYFYWRFQLFTTTDTKDFCDRHSLPFLIGLLDLEYDI